MLKAMVAIMFGVAFLWRCANAMAPTGGPRDSLPPVVIGASPSFNTTNFKQKRVTISFNEYVQLQNQQSEFFISPPLRKKPTVTLKGRGVQIDILDTLQENTTYALNFGNSIKDNNEGNKLGSFRYVFSTGSEIDSMYMSGYAVNAYSGDSISNPLIFFYRAERDSVPEYDSTLLNLTPDVLARGESNGVFLAQNLKPIDYRVYAVADRNQNFAYDPGVDDVAFLDSVLNPLHMPDFSVWYDTTRNVLLADPQVNFRLFRDTAFKRQKLNNSTRPSQHQLHMEFSAPYPDIRELAIDGVDNGRIITEYVTADRDTINYWLDVPSASLPDTVKGRMIYMKHDSISNLVPDTVKLALFWKHVESESERKAREEEEKKRARAERNGEEYKEPEKKNPFSYTITRGNVNPEQHVKLSFDLPLSSVDTSKLLLIRTEGEKMFRVRYSLDRDTADVRAWHLSSEWNQGGSYKIVALPGTFTDVAGQQNDSISNDIKILSAEEYGTLSVNVTGKTPEAKYVLYLLNESGSVLQTKRDVMSGKTVFRFISPGNVKLKILEDVNGNGEWDTGNLVLHRHPERNELYYSSAGEDKMAMKANWEVEIDVDMNSVFAPVTTESMRSRIALLERIRQRKMAEERAQREKQSKTSTDNGLSSQGMGTTGFGNGSGLGSLNGLSGLTGR